MNVLLFGVILLIALITFNTSFFNPFKKAFQDFSFANIYFTRMADTTKLDTNIILVNSGTLTREGHARLIANLSKFHPKIIGIDHLYLINKPDDSLFINAIKNAPTIVAASNLVNFTDDKYHSVLRSAPHFPFRFYGFSNFPVDDPHLSTIRHTKLSYAVGNDTILSFAAKIVEQYDPDAFINAKRYFDDAQLINYTGNLSCYITLDYRNCLDSLADLAIVRNKIVLIGYLGDSLNSQPLKLEDIFYTPMNTRVAGHTYPDMYGAVIHANIISMILQDKFIYCVPFYFECLFAFTITFLVLLVVVHLYGKDYESYETIVVIIQYISAGLLLFIYFILFAKARVSFNMTLPIIGMISLQLGVNTYHSLIKFLKRFIHLKFLKSW